MAKLKMMKIELLALLEDSKKIIDLLQRKGVVELTDEEQEEGLQKFATAGWRKPTGQSSKR